MAELPTAHWQEFASPAQLVAALADSLAEDFRDAVAARGAMLFGASGGSTPKPVYERLAAMDLPWASLTVLIVDERFVPLDDEFSNQRMIVASLLRGHTEAKCIGLWSAAATLDAAAMFAAERVQAIGRCMDTVLLGMGEDGHFASCFPTATQFAAAVAPDTADHVLSIAPMPPGVFPARERLTLTWSYIRQARRIVLALTGVRKREVLLRAMHDQDPARLPIAALFKTGMPQIEIYWSQ